MRRGSNKHLTQEEILYAARRLLITDGYEGLSMRKLAAKLNCQAPTLYYYYKNKTAIIEELIEEGFRMLIEADKITAEKNITPFEKIEEFCRNYIDFATQNPGYYFVMYSMKLDSDHLREKIYEEERILGGILLGIVKEGVADGSVKAKNPLLIITYTWSVLHGLVTNLSGGRMDPRFDTITLTESILEVLFNSYKTPLELEVA